MDEGTETDASNDERRSTNSGEPLSRPPSRISRPPSRDQQASADELSEITRVLKDRLQQQKSGEEGHLDKALAYGKSVIMSLPEEDWRSAADDLTIWILKYAHSHRGDGHIIRRGKWRTPTCSRFNGFIRLRTTPPTSRPALSNLRCPPCRRRLR